MQVPRLKALSPGYLLHSRSGGKRHLQLPVGEQHLKRLLTGKQCAGCTLSSNDHGLFVEVVQPSKLPELTAHISGSSIRVPTPDVSMAILNLTLEKETTREEMVDYLREASLHSPMKRQIDFIASPDSVSTDFVGSRHASIVDANATIVNGSNAIVYLWYDNEFGYSCQVVRVVQHISGVEYPLFPQD